MKLIVTGSIAFDYLMSFPGRFTEHFLPEHMHRLSLSFLVDSMDKRRGGCGPNIAYTIALLGERPYLMATAGQDFPDYRAWLDAVNIDTSLVKMIDGKFCASFFCSTDQHENQIASFYTGAMANAGELSMRTVPGIKDAMVIVAPNDPEGMVQYAEECAAMGVKYIWDPGQQCARMEGSQLASGVTGAFMVIVNDYEMELLRQKTGMSEADVLRHAPLLVITKGEKGCSIHTKDGVEDVPAVTPERIADPTGVGDAFRGGFMKGLAMAAPYGVCGRLGSVAATYALEHLGGTSHAYTWNEFTARYEQHFGKLQA
jgi:adenosine kinase